MRTWIILAAGLALSLGLSLIFPGFIFLFVPLVFAPVLLKRRGN